jgi:hypothetical protein
MAMRVREGEIFACHASKDVENVNFSRTEMYEWFFERSVAVLMC